MANDRLHHKKITILQVLDDHLVGLFHLHALKVRHGFHKATRLVQRARRLDLLRKQAMLQAYTVVVLTERRCLVHNTRTRIRRNVLVRQDAEGATLVFLVKVREKRHVLFADEVLAHVLFHRLDLCLLRVFVDRRE